MRAQGYFPKGSSTEQDQILDDIIEHAGEGTVGIFDLDGTLFDTRVRQIAIFREFASRTRNVRLYDIQPCHFTDWNLTTPLRAIGMSATEIQEISKDLEEYWVNRFFSSEYCQLDHAMPGGCQLVEECYRRGMYVVYLTGRDHTMRSGTERSLRNFGFPYQCSRTKLITKPHFKMDDTRYKADALIEIETLGQPTVFLDNEPANVNLFHKTFSDSLVVFVETDHSFLEHCPDPTIPWIRSLYRSTWPGSIHKPASIYLD